MGRPKKDPEKVKDHQFRIRLTNREFETLNSIAKELKTTKSEAIRMMLFESKNILRI